jgi:hypothetical protein
LLLCIAIAASSRTLTVTMAVTVPSTSIGSRLRAIRPNLTFQDLSTSIDPQHDCRPRRRSPVRVGEARRKGWHQTPQTIVPPYFFDDSLAVTRPPRWKHRSSVLILLAAAPTLLLWKPRRPHADGADQVAGHRRGQMITRAIPQSPVDSGSERVATRFV